MLGFTGLGQLPVLGDGTSAFVRAADGAGDVGDGAVCVAVQAPAGTFQRFDYPGHAHLFADVDHPDCAKAEAESMLERVLSFLGD